MVQSSSSFTATQTDNVKFEHLGEISKKEDSSAYLEKFTLKEKAGYASSDIQSDVVSNAKYIKKLTFILSFFLYSRLARK